MYRVSMQNENAKPARQNAMQEKRCECIREASRRFIGRIHMQQLQLFEILKHLKNKHGFHDPRIPYHFNEIKMVQNLFAGSE